MTCHFVTTYCLITCYEKKKAKEKHFLPVNLKIYHFVVAIEREAKKVPKPMKMPYNVKESN